MPKIRILNLYISTNQHSHDRAEMWETNKKREAEGKPLLDERYFKDRYSAYISVGGANTRNWVALGLPIVTRFMSLTIINNFQ